MKLAALLLAAASLLALPAAAQPTQPSPVPKKVARALSKVRPEAIKSHIWYLADDKLQGRQAGTPGYQMAVEYVTAQLRQLGVEPAGENGTYVQRVRLRRATALLGATLTRRDAAPGSSPQPLAYATDFVFNPHPEQPAATVEAPVAFAGYGISAPELGYDDYAGLDVKGKLVMIVRGAPRNFPSTVAAASQDLLMTMQNAARHGAVGVLVAATVAPRTAPSPTTKRITTSVLNAEGKVAVSRTFIPNVGLQVVGNLGASAFQNLLRTAALDSGQVLAALRQGKPASAALPTTLRAEYRSAYQDFDSYNVVGKITGSDAKLRDEYVVHSAHLDHLGVAAPVNGDSIYNGAHDNASGAASVLEIANIYSHLKQKPSRSLLFVLQTGEELGLLGSAYFASNPTVPKANIVADVNTDMPTIIAPLLSVVPLGAQHSTLSQPVAEAAQYLGLTVEADPEPDQNRFIRSDQYSFVMQGIPALHIKYGNRTADGKNNLSEQVQKWRAVTYHKPQDDTSGVFDFEAGKKYVQLNFLIGYLVAQNPARPTWNSGDFFGQRFAQQR
ncbi:Zn-dependent amino- or carboxypeptidase, M28 family [Hymenobacter gelipurpurascens]|uniref:Zn-dependent amino- or carboxypeptidase, M28 family n=1 Tax=Hymenobacter gelipurpurascens TaxID=89968 RepID=A0A212T094_9BACT|nr:M28 family peptidase [Hymenobacter gelipurpurascens]SNC59448.1 Zn-dependent amino- or carboxypeptidase, M28 family [Hymenobacter gelipurpurascens]